MSEINITEQVAEITTEEGNEVIEIVERGLQGPAGSGTSANGDVGALYPGASISENTDGTVTIGEASWNLHPDANQSGDLDTYIIPETSLGPVNAGVPCYIVADYNGGSPVYRDTLDVEEINESNIAPVFSLGLDDQGILHIIDWDSLGQGKADKGHLHQVKHQRFSSWDGLAPSIDGALHFLLEAGRVFIGWVPHTLEAFNSANAVLIPDAAETLFYEYAKDNLEVWGSTLVQEYDNDNYNPAGGVTALGNSKYVVLWFFRDLDSAPHVGYVRSVDQYNTPAEALIAPIRSDLPALFHSHGALVAKVVVQKGALTGDVRNLLDTAIPATPVSDHNDLAGRSSTGAHPSTAISVDTAALLSLLQGIAATNQAMMEALDVHHNSTRSVARKASVFIVGGATSISFANFYDSATYSSGSNEGLVTFGTDIISAVLLFAAGAGVTRYAKISFDFSVNAPAFTGTAWPAGINVNQGGTRPVFATGTKYAEVFIARNALGIFYKVLEWSA